jgi:hypothetical protein
VKGDHHQPTGTHHQARCDQPAETARRDELELTEEEVEAATVERSTL